MDRLLLANARVATMASGRYSIVERATVCAEEGRIAWVKADAAASDVAGERLDLHGALVTPGLTDCHTHLVYGGDRARDFALRQGGMSYAQIAQAGGGSPPRSPPRAPRATRTARGCAGGSEGCRRKA